ncbi:MAG: GIY-YIG nuclease family protein [bacterium]
MANKRKSSVKGRKPWFLYLIECEDKSVYTGIALDVSARYAAHKQGAGARYTRAHPPQKLLAVVKYSSRSAASQAEYLVKQMTAREKRGFAGTVKRKRTPETNFHQ